MGQGRRLTSFEPYDVVMCTRNVPECELKKYQDTERFIRFPVTTNGAVLKKLTASGKKIKQEGEFFVTDTAEKSLWGSMASAGSCLHTMLSSMRTEPSFLRPGITFMPRLLQSIKARDQNGQRSLFFSRREILPQTLLL